MNEYPILPAFRHYTDWNLMQLLELILLSQVLLIGLLAVFLAFFLINIVVDLWCQTPPPPPIDYRRNRR